MTQERNELYEKTMQMLKPALERVASDPAFRNRLETNPLAALAEINVELDAETRRELEGKRFSEFWALRRSAAGGPEVRDLPPADGELDDATLGKVAGGAIVGIELNATFKRIDAGGFSAMERFAPPYVPV